MKADEEEANMQTLHDILLRFSGKYSLSVSTRLAARSSFIEDLQIGQASELPTLDLAFPVEGQWGTVGIRVSQRKEQIDAQLFANPDGTSHQDVRAQLERMICLDTDAKGLAEIVAPDKVIADLDNHVVTFAFERPNNWETVRSSFACSLVSHFV